LVHWQTTVLVPDLVSAAHNIRRGGFRVVSLGTGDALVVRDPDGHAIQLIEDRGAAHAEH
ncbi:MAG TPA: hypothetical protein VJQ44_18770, partial [Gemmatimonadales bacterium]|nr:hypothetical protein [Gemmatimonadales bacterium]